MSEGAGGVARRGQGHSSVRPEVFCKHRKLHHVGPAEPARKCKKWLFNAQTMRPVVQLQIDPIHMNLALKVFTQNPHQASSTSQFPKRILCATCEREAPQQRERELFTALPLPNSALFPRKRGDKSFGGFWFSR